MNRNRNRNRKTFIFIMQCSKEISARVYRIKRNRPVFVDAVPFKWFQRIPDTYVRDQVIISHLKRHGVLAAGHQRDKDFVLEAV